MSARRFKGWLDRPLLAWGVLAAGLVTTFGAWLGVGTLLDRRAADDLAREGAALASEVEQSTRRHLDLVASMQALFSAAARTPDRAEFGRYVSGLDLRANYPAVKSLRYAPLVPQTARAGFEARADRSIERGGIPGYVIRPPGERTEYLPILFAEPFASGSGLFGQDELAEADRRGAIALARDTGLVQVAQGPEGTLNVRAAVYRGDARLVSLEDRRLAHAGQVSAVVRVADIVLAAVPERVLRRTAFLLADVGTGWRDETARTLFDTPAPVEAPVWVLAHATRFEIGGRIWEARFTRPHVPGLWQGASLLLLFSGLVASLGLFRFLRAFVRQRLDAARLAERMSARALEREREYRVLVEQLREIVARVDRDGMITYLNPAWERITGYRIADATGRRLADFVHVEDRQAAVAGLRALAEGALRESAWTARFVTRADEPRWLETRWQIVRDGDGRVDSLTGTLFDVTDRTLVEREVQQRAQHDALTGLPNRLLLEDRFAMALAQAMRQDSHLGLLYIDLDGVGQVNDTHGREAGDEMLRAVAARLRGAVRGTDTVARVGGDAFVVLLPGAQHPEVTHRVASTIAGALGADIPVGEQRLRITPSVGVAAYPHDGDSLASLLASAEAALNRAKHAGASRIQVHAEVLGVTGGPQPTEAEARGSVGRNEIAVRFAPQLDLASGRIAGAALCLHWQGRADGASPSRFLPVTEEAGLIVPLGQWSMLAALRECHAWNARADGKARVMLDVSLRELQQANFAAAVERAIVRSDVDAGDVWLSVESRVASRPSSAVIVSLRELAVLGCHVGVQDLAGSPLDYASVAGDLPIRFAVVGRHRWSEGARRLELPFLQAARARGWRLVADDVRTTGDADLVMRMGFDYAQGPVAGPIATADAMADLFTRPLVDGRGRGSASAA